MPIGSKRSLFLVWFLGVGAFYLITPFLGYFYERASGGGSWATFFIGLVLSAILLTWMLFGVICILVLKIKKIERPRLRAICTAGILSFSIALITCGVALSVRHFLTPPLPWGSELKKFDSKAWLTKSSENWTEEGISEREKMLGDLVKNVLPGKKRDEIEKILGPSMETSYFQSIGKDLIYFLGPERGAYMNIDSEWLLLWVDENGEFRKYEIRND